MPIAEVQAAFQTNFFAPIRLIQRIAPLMATNKTASQSEVKGLIVNIGSINGVVPIPWGGIYASTKAALRNLSQSLYNELSPFGVRVMLVEPGGIQSNVRLQKVYCCSLSATHPDSADTQVSTYLISLPNSSLVTMTLQLTPSHPPPSILRSSQK